MFTKNFRSSEGELIRTIRLTFEQSYTTLDLNQLLGLVGILRLVGYSVEAEDWIVKHLDAVLPNLDATECASYLNSLGQGGYVDKLKKRLEELQPAATPQELTLMIAGGSWNPQDIDSLNALEHEFYRQWFLTDDGPLLITISRFLKNLASLPPNSPEGRLRQKVEDVLRSLASESNINQSRVRYTFNLEPSRVTGNELKPL